MKKNIIRLFSIGVDSHSTDSFNRVTIFTNLSSFIAIFTLPFVYMQLRTFGLGNQFTIYLPIFILLVTSIPMMNFIKWYTSARLTFYFLILIFGFYTAFIFGKSFNGYYLFFLIIIYSIYAFTYLNRFWRFFFYFLSLSPLPIVDILSHNKIIPLTGLNSSNFPVSILLTDTFAITIAMSGILMVEKYFADNHENYLKSFNQKLEKLVRSRTQLLIEAREQTIKANLIKSQFLANTSHELRTPLQGILGNLELLQENISTSQTPENQKLHRYLGNTLKSTKRLDLLIERLLELTTIDDDREKVYPTPFDLNDFIVETVNKHDFHQKHIQVKVNPINQKTTVRTDSSDLALGLNCLLENALDYGSPNRMVIVDVQSLENSYSILVTNTGPIIPKEEQNLIFEPFYQSTVTDNATGGSGIGLALAKKHIKLINGNILLKGSAQMATTFEISFKNIS